MGAESAVLCRFGMLPALASRSCRTMRPAACLLQEKMCELGAEASSSHTAGADHVLAACACNPLPIP